jgi:hypothetical protein
VRGEDPEFALRLQRLLVGEQSTMWLRVRAFAVHSLDDGLLEPRLATLASIVPEAKGVRWVCVTEREWCDRLARALAPIRRTQSDGVASAIERIVPQPRAFAAIETNERALDRALAGWSPSWSRSYAIVTDEKAGDGHDVLRGLSVALVPFGGGLRPISEGGLDLSLNRAKVRALR